MTVTTFNKIISFHLYVYITRSLFHQNYMCCTCMLCAIELGYSKFILHKEINMSLQQGSVRTTNTEGESKQAINLNHCICIKKTTENNVHVNIIELTVYGLHLHFFYTPRHYLKFSQIDLSYFVRRYLSAVVLYSTKIKIAQCYIFSLRWSDLLLSYTCSI